MKIKNKPSSSTKKLVAIILVTLVFAVIVTAVAYMLSRQRTPASNQPSTDQPTTTDTVNLDPPTTDQQTAADEQKKQSLDNEQSTPPNTSPLSVIISAANENSSTSMLQIRTLIDKITSTGQCTLTLQKSGQTITKTATIQAGPSNSTCQGFDVALSELSSGTWQISVSVSSGDQSGSATSEVTINAS